MSSLSLWGETSPIIFTAIVTRLGACLALMPGFGSARFSPQLRIMLVLVLSLLLFPLLVVPNQAVPFAKVLPLMLGELVIGATLGLMARLTLLALQFAGSLITTTTGLAAIPGVPIEDNEVSPPLVTLLMLTATVLIFSTDLHYEMLAALLDSYKTMPMGSVIEAGWQVDVLLAKLASTFDLGLRLASPFVAFSVLVNLAIGFLNKFTPQISVYFMTTGLVAIVALILCYVMIDDFLGIFLQEFRGFAG